MVSLRCTSGCGPASAASWPVPSRVAYAVSDRILAAVMPGPQRPIEIREFDRPELPTGGALLRTARSEVCGTDVHLWHGRLSGVPYPIIPGHVSAGMLDRGARSADRDRRRASARRGSRRVLRRASNLRPLPRLRRPPHADAMRRAARLRHHRLGDEGLFGGWSQAVYLEPGVGIARLPDRVTFDDYIGGGCGLLTAVHIIERAALRPATACSSREPARSA